MPQKNSTYGFGEKVVAVFGRYYERCLIGFLSLGVFLFLGLKFYDFWLFSVVPFLEGVATLSVLTFVVTYFGVEAPKYPLKSERLRRDIRWGVGGVLVAYVLVYMHSCTAAGLMEQPSDTLVGSPPALEETLTSESENPQDSEEDEISGILADEVVPDLSTDTDIVSPETVITHVDSLNRADAMTPPNTVPSLVAVIEPDLERMELSRTPENQNAWSALLADTVKRKILSDSQPEDDLVNGNPAFTRRTQEANELQAALSDNGMDPDKLKAIIQLREEAYDIYATKGLRHLLASDYHRWAKACSQVKDWEQTYEYYLKSIEFEIIYIRLVPELNDEYFDHLYNIATIYQCLGDIPTLKADDKKDAYFLSACFYEIVCKHTFDSSDEKTGFLSAYYAGMVHHKLYLLGWRERIRASEVYLCDAIAHYEKSLEFSDYGKQRHYQYDFLAQMSGHAQKYIQYFGQPASMLTKAEYRDMEMRYQDLAH